LKTAPGFIIVECSGFHGNPHPAAKLLIVGITPGRHQFELAQVAMQEKLSPAEFQERVAFAGSMRINLVAMLDEIGVAEALRVRSTAELFGTTRLASTSAVRDPVFVNGRNWSGKSPGILQNARTRAYVETHLRASLVSVPRALVVPLGKTVDIALRHLEQAITPERVLFGFPHPSGANGHRVRLFSEAKSSLWKRVREWQATLTLEPTLEHS
jgi:Uracil DNA glycosylase superfamily